MSQLAPYASFPDHSRGRLHAEPKSDIRGPREQVVPMGEVGATGLLVKPGDAAALATALREVLAVFQRQTWHPALVRLAHSVASLALRWMSRMSTTLFAKVRKSTIAGISILSQREFVNGRMKIRVRTFTLPTMVLTLS